VNIVLIVIKKLEVTESIVLSAMFKLMNMADRKIINNTAINRLVCNTFGITADVVAVVWNLLVKNVIYHNRQKFCIYHGCCPTLRHTAITNSIQ
jgi:hypothetical protein